MNEFIKLSLLILAVLLGCLALALPVQATSFDCAKAQANAEKLICADAELSKLDEELNISYKAGLQDEKRANSIRQAQKKWMRERNGCFDAACVKRAYEGRLQALGKIDSNANSDATGMVASPTQTDKEKSARPKLPKMSSKLRYAFCDKSQPGLYCEGQTGKGYSVCEAYLKHLNTLSTPATCEAPIPPGFKQPDWEEMDVTQHLDLAYQAEKYFLKFIGLYNPPDFDKWRQTFLQEIKEGKIAPRMSKAKITPNDKGEAIILAYNRDHDACHKVYGIEKSQDAKATRELTPFPKSYWSSQGNAGQAWAEQGNVHFMLPVNSPHTLQVIVGIVSRRNADLLLFSGRPYFIGIDRLYLTNDRGTDSAKVTVYAFDPRLPDRTGRFSDMNNYMAEPLCQLFPY